MDCPVVKSIAFTDLSHDPEKTFVLSALHAQQSAGCSWVMATLGTVFPVEVTSQIYV
jgi:hypothetical protein